MRSQQNGRRQRNRGNRRNQNPLSRNYESNGPDVKIRGNAQVIADKYAALARDAMSAGDRVMAENYLQHAEHYNRIILAAQPAPRPDDNDGDDNDNENDIDDNDTDDVAEVSAEEERPQRKRRDAANEPQPEIEGTPVEVSEEQAEVAAKERKPRRPRRKKTDAPEAEGDNQVAEAEVVAVEETPQAAE